MKQLKLQLTLFILITISSISFAIEKKSPDVFVINDIKHDISMPLRNILPSNNNNKSNVGTSFFFIKKPSLVHLDAFKGIGIGLGHYQVRSAFPMLSGAVGLSQYVQAVTPDIAVFDKITGQVMEGFPKPSNNLWIGFGGPCETQNDNVTSVNYDQINNRWVLLSQAVTNNPINPFFLCIALSTTDDATDTYYRYAFAIDSLSNSNAIGLRDDAYYLSLAMLGPINEGPRACALDSSKMIEGLGTTMQCKQLSVNESGVLRPAHLEGYFGTVGLPGFFFSLNPPHHLLLFKFHVDFANPNRSTFSSAIPIQVNSFTQPCPRSDGNQCVVQPDTSNKLNLVGDRFLSAINFRKFNNFSSFVLVHNVQGRSPKLSPALRWYELRMANSFDAIPTVYQQGTLAEDSKARFTGSIAIDKYQNIVMGYTVSSSRIHPSPEFRYKNFSTKLNDFTDSLTLQPMITSFGSQTKGSSWATNAVLNTDPEDNCTFWYTGEYLKTDGSFNWSTAIVHFKLANC